MLRTRIVRESDYSPTSAILDVRCTIVTFLHNHANNLYINGHKTVANLRKLTINTPNLDLVNDNLYTKFGLQKSICSQDMEQTEFWRQSRAVNLLQMRKMMIYNPNVDHVNDNVYTKIWLNSIHSFSRYWTKTELFRNDRETEGQTGWI